MPKKILVTGAAGFIGFHAALALVKRGDQVVGLDNFNNYYSPELKTKRASLLAKEGIFVQTGDVCDRELISQIIDTQGITHILHLAAQAGVRYARENPRSYLHSNLEGFLSVLEACRLAPHIPLIYASSSSVYGCNTKIPFAVSDQTDRPANLYAATKKANELMAYSYHHLYGIRCTGLRYFTVYGPWGRPDMAYFLFTKALIEGRPITLFNEGKMERDFTYIDDVVSGTLAALDLAAPWEVFNLGNHRSEPLMHLVELLEGKLGRKAEVILAGPSPGEVEKTFADIEYAKQKLGYTPTTSLKEGLARFVDWYIENTSGSAAVMSDATMQ